MNRVRCRVRARGRVSGRVKVRVRVRRGRGWISSSAHSVHSIFIELQLLIIPQHLIYIPPRLLLFRHYEPTKKKLRSSIRIRIRVRIKVRVRASSRVWDNGR